MIVASFHLIRYPRRAAALALPRVPVDRRRLARTPGLRFGKLLGTGSGRTMAVSADLRRWAVFAVWDERASLDRFLATHLLSQRWERDAEERYDVVLEPLGAHGTWNGVDPIAGAARRAASLGGTDIGGPVAVLTRATVRWRRLRPFLAAVPAVDAVLAGADGLLATAGIGEVPVGRQATFSLWRNGDAVRDFAYRSAEHAEVVRRTRDEAWYGEEWFARFRPISSSGTWNGQDPLA